MQEPLSKVGALGSVGAMARRTAERRHPGLPACPHPGRRARHRSPRRADRVPPPHPPLALRGALVRGAGQRYALPRSIGEPWLASLRDGLAYLRRTPAARMLVTGLTGLNVFITPVVALGVALRVSQSGWGSAWVGLAEAGLVAGAIVGSLLAIRRPPARLARAAFTVLVLQGAAMAAVAADRRAVLVAAMVVIGLTAGLASVWLSAVFQRTIAASHLGRVSSVTVLGDRSLTPLALLVFGALAAGGGLTVACCLFGAARGALCLGLAGRRAVAALV